MVDGVNRLFRIKLVSLLTRKPRLLTRKPRLLRDALFFGDVANDFASLHSMRRGSKSKVAATGKNSKSSRATPTQPSGNGVKRSRQAALDEELDSGDSGDEEAAQHAAMLAGEAEDDEELKESAEERRVRLAKEMIAAMDAAAARRREGAADVSGVARGAHADEIAQELEEDAMRRAGQYRFLAAEQLRGVQLDPSASRVFRGPRLSATSVAVAPDESFVVCGCKDGALVRWDLQSGARTKLLGGRATALHGARAGGGGEHGDGAGTSNGNSQQPTLTVSRDFSMMTAINAHPGTF